jgi:hypothetical protein
MTQNAILILEQPWFGLGENPNRASVYPFFLGLEKLTDNVKVYHTVFYEKISFRQALDDLSTARFDNLFLYVAAHGSGGKIAGLQSKGVFADIKRIAETVNIVGAVIGSCFSGTRPENFVRCMAGSRLTWMVGYNCAVDWLPATLIDLSIFSSMISLDGNQLKSRDVIFNKLKHGITYFNQNKVIGSSADLSESYNTKKSVSIFVQHRAGGTRPKDMTQELVSQW